MLRIALRAVPSHRPGMTRWALRDLAFRPIISEASLMISDLHPSPALFASPRLRGEADARNARRVRGALRGDGGSETRGDSPSPRIRAARAFPPLPASGGRPTGARPA